MSTALQLTGQRASTVRAAVPDDLKAQSDKRYEAIALLLDYYNGRGLPDSFKSVTELKKYLAGSHNLSVRWIEEYVRRFRNAQRNNENPYAALCDRVRKDRGKWRVLTDDHRAYIENKLLKERIQNVSLIHEALQRDFP